MKTQPNTYRLRNWKEYTASLVGRGSLWLWIAADIGDWWLCTEPSGKPGASPSYSERDIEVCLSLRVLFRLPLRQVEGFVRSLFALAGVSLPVPDYTTLCRRQTSLGVGLPVRPGERARHIVMDSTGLKVYGEGEWKVKKHGVREAAGLEQTAPVGGRDDGGGAGGGDDGWGRRGRPAPARPGRSVD